jgi:hypothetical protein
MVGIVGTNKLFTFFWNETQYYAVVFKVVQNAKKNAISVMLMTF